MSKSSELKGRKKQSRGSIRISHPLSLMSHCLCELKKNSFGFFQAIIFFAVVACAAARALLPNQSADAQAETVRQDSAVNVDNFQYVYQTSNGIAAQEQGQLKQIGKEAGIATQGEYR